MSNPRFFPRNLTVLGYANGFTMWHYVQHPDPQGGTIAFDTPGYFNSACEMMRKGDVIVANAFNFTTQLVVVSVDQAKAEVVVKVMSHVDYDKL